MLPLLNDDGSITIKRGDRMAGTVQFTAVDGSIMDLTGYDFALYIGSALGEAHWLALTTTPPAGLVVSDPATGQVSYDLAARDTLKCQQGACAYDFKLISGDDVETLMSGTGSVIDEVK